MLLPLRFTIASLLLCISFQLAQGSEATESLQTLVFIRHGEKPKANLGQLDCRGFNRSLKLPAYFRANFPPPDAIFAPLPAPRRHKKHGRTSHYDYIRPLATIEPTAIAFGLPLNVEIPQNRPRQLITALLNRRYKNSVIYIAWEHKYLVEIGRLLLKRFNNPTDIAIWQGHDFERVLVFEIATARNGKQTLTFHETSQNLGEMSEECMLPSPAAI